MQNNQRTRVGFLLGGGALIVLSLVLFLSALAIRDFGQAGQGLFFSGRSGILLAISFALLGGFALALLIVVFRTSNRHAAEPVSIRTHSRGKDARTKMPAADAREAVEGPENPAQRDAPEIGRDTSVQLLSATAGELRTSVGAIQEELEEMMDDEDPLDQEHMQSLFEETDRLKKIIDGMEQLSQAQALARSLAKVSVELEPLLRKVTEKTRLAANGPDVTIALECEPGLTMIADPECLRRIMENLMDNAARAVKNAGAVTLAALREGDQVRFSVSDTGTGIRSKHLSHIYERFFRGTGMGIGMGLTIVKELVDACGGKIEVQTELGKGSVFIVRLSAS